jgi:hypothetical protein
MKKIHSIVMQTSYLAGLICTACGVGVRVLWHFHRATTYDHHSWFLAATAFLLCSLASHRMSQI